MSEVHDYGFDMPDIRHTFIARTQEDDPEDFPKITVRIQRHWQPHPEDPDSMQYKCSFDIFKDDQLVLQMPIGTREEQAREVAHILFQEDEEQTNALLDIMAMERAEQRVGA